MASRSTAGGGGTRTYMRKRDDGTWIVVVTDLGDPAAVLGSRIASDAEATALAAGYGTEYVSPRHAN